MSVLLQPNEIRSMTAQAVRRLVEAGDGDCALLYLALLEWDEYGKAQRALHWGDDRLSAAQQRLAGLGLVASEPAPVAPRPEQTEELPRYSRKDIADALEREPEFCGLYREVERLLGRGLSDADLEALYTIYDGLALPTEVVLLLVTYMIHRARQQSGKPRAVPRMSQIRTEAFRWKRRGIDNAEAADGYIRAQQQVESREWAILSAVGVAEPRPAVEKERNFIESWVELGISDELISMAYERTIYSKGKMNWPYVNKILMAWHQAGWRTPEQVKAGDKLPRRGAPPKVERKQEDYQPSAQRIRESGDWLDEFLRQQGKGE